LIRRNPVPKRRDNPEPGTEVPHNHNEIRVPFKGRHKSASRDQRMADLLRQSVRKPVLSGERVVSGLADDIRNPRRSHQDDPVEGTIAFQVFRAVEEQILAANICRE